MIKGALFTLGILATLGGGGLAVLSIMAAGMSDAPGQSVDIGLPASVFGFGITMIVGACFL